MKVYSFYILILFFLVIPFTTSLYAQQPKQKDFDKLRVQVLSEYAATDIEKAFRLVDSLQGLATSEKERIQVDMVQAVLHYNKGDKISALDLAMEAENRFQKNKNYGQQVGVIGFIASNFKEMGLNTEAKFYLDKAMKSIPKLKNKSLKAQYGTLLNHELFGINMDLLNYKEARTNIKEAYNYVKEIEGKQHAFFLATTMQLDASLEYLLTNYTKAKELYNTALEVLDTKEELLYGIIHLGLAKIAIKEEEFHTALVHLLVVEEMVKNSQYYALKRDLYESYVQYYEDIGDEIQFQTYTLKLNELKIHNEQEVIVISNAALLKLREKIRKGEKRTSKLMGVFIILFIGGSATYFYLRRRNLLVYNSEGLNNSTISKRRNGRSIATNSGNNSMEAISDETEARILEGLNKIEKTTFFIASDITLDRLAFQLETNSRYLSYIINKHREKKFPVYINDLRINYIVDKLNKDPLFLKYKISHLAQLSGFSSHSKFSSEFKRVVGKAPSLYIAKVQNNLEV